MLIATKALRSCVLLLLGASMFASAADAQTLYVDEQFDFELTSGIVFVSKPVGDPATNLDLHLELYEPSGVGIPSLRPAIVAIHGGGFIGGNRFSSTQIGTCERMARRGYTCVSIDYRLLGDEPVVGPEYALLEAGINAMEPTLGTAIAAGTEDSVAAIAWLVSNSVGLDIDTTKIGLAGYSAGGALTEFVTYLAPLVGVTMPASPRATFNLAGSFDPTLTIVEPGNAPALLVHGDADTVVDIAGAYALELQLQAAGVPYDLVVLPGFGHGINIFVDEAGPGETIFERVVSFFALHLASDVTALPGLSPPATLGLALVLIACSRRALTRRIPGRQVRDDLAA
jgi:acetyl esterase/lipase